MFIVTLHRVSEHARGILLPLQGPKKGKVLLNSDECYIDL